MSTRTLSGVGGKPATWLIVKLLFFSSAERPFLAFPMACTKAACDGWSEPISANA
jgi:hypothetical protein